MGLEGSSFLVACSGGVDSLALALVIKALSHKVPFNWALAYIHHGQQDQSPYRDQALEFVRGLAAELGVPFYCNEVEVRKELKSESEESLRQLRRRELFKLQRQHGYTHIAQGHHWDDLLETRLIRLIRGTGSEGLPSMQVLSEQEEGCIYRPLLALRRSELEEYVRSCWSGDWVEDPSNKSCGPLRNWIRQQWLPLLEDKRSGAVEALGRSLQNLVDGGCSDSNSLHGAIQGQRVCRLSYESLPESDQKRLLAFYLKEQKIKSYTSGHINEIYKRLQTSRKEFSFTVAKCQWDVKMDSFGLSCV